MFTKVEANSSASLSARFAGFMRRPTSSAKPSSTLRPMAAPLAMSAGRLARAAEVLAGDSKFKAASIRNCPRLVGWAGLKIGARWQKTGRYPSWPDPS